MNGTSDRKSVQPVRRRHLRHNSGARRRSARPSIVARIPRHAFTGTVATVATAAYRGNLLLNGFPVMPSPETFATVATAATTANRENLFA